MAFGLAWLRWPWRRFLAAVEAASAPSTAFGGPPPPLRGGGPVDWGAVRAAYEAGQERVAAIRTRLGVRRDDMRARCRAEGWRRRPTDAAGLARLRSVQRLARVEAELKAAEEAEEAEEAVPWQEVRAAYEAGVESVAAIRARFGLTERQLRRKREEGRWATRPRVAEPGPRQGRRPATAERLEKRLGRAIEAGLAEMEAARVAGAAPDPDEARRLAELTRAYVGFKRLEAGGTAAARARARRPPLAPGEVLMPRDQRDIERWGMTPEEVELADEHWMREELKRRTDILKANLQWHEEQAAKQAAAEGEALAAGAAEPWAGGEALAAGDPRAAIRRL